MNNLEFLTPYLQEAAMIKQRRIMSVAIVSFNRLHYLRALIKSLIETQDMSMLDVFIVDNCSDEDGFREFKYSLDSRIRFISCKSTHAEAMNLALQKAETGYICILPDDCQFIFAGSTWINDCVNVLQNNEQIGSIVIDGQRRITLKKFFSRLRNPFYHCYKAGYHRFYSYGNKKTGLSPAGLNTVYRLSDLISIGGWKQTQQQQNVKDSSLGAEDEFQERQRNHTSYSQTERVVINNPVVLETITDMRGSPSKIRNGKRLYNYFRAESDMYFCYVSYSWKQKKTTAVI